MGSESAVKLDGQNMGGAGGQCAGDGAGSGADLDSPPAVDDTAAGDEEGSGS